MKEIHGCLRTAPRCGDWHATQARARSRAAKCPCRALAHFFARQHAMSSAPNIWVHIALTFLSLATRRDANMLPRSAAGRAIAKEVDTGVSAPRVEQSRERFIVLKKKTRESLLGVRFGIHPTTGQVVVTVSAARKSKAQLPWTGAASSLHLSSRAHSGGPHLTHPPSVRLLSVPTTLALSPLPHVLPRPLAARAPSRS